MLYYLPINRNETLAESQNKLSRVAFALLKEKMDEFISVGPNGKPAWCLEDLRKFSLIKRQGILKYYHENMSGKKTDLLTRTF